MIASSRAAVKLRSAISTLGFREKCSRGNPPSSTSTPASPSARASADLCSQAAWRCAADDDDAGIGAGDHRLGEFGLDQVRLAGKGAIDDRIELHLGGVGHDRHHVVERHLALAMREQRELAQFVARGLAVAAEQRISAARASGAMRRVAIAQFVVDQFARSRSPSG